MCQALSVEGGRWKSKDLMNIWMDGQPAPQAIIDLLACNCKKKCELPKCECMASGLKCTDMCTLQNCENQANQEDNEEDSETELDNDEIVEDSDNDEIEEDCEYQTIQTQAGNCYFQVYELLIIGSITDTYILHI